MPAARVPFVGRREEMAVLEDEFARAAAGEFRVLLLSGEAGVGKSRLGRELLVRHPDAAGMFARTHRLGATAAFAVWTEAIEPLLRVRSDTGLRNLPLKGFAQNQVWCEIVALACELLAWTQMLALAGDARRWEPKRLRLCLFSAAGRLARGGRRLRLRLATRWLWAANITAAVAHLQALPAG